MSIKSVLFQYLYESCVTYTNPLENGQIRPKSYIASERPQLWQRNVPFFSNFFLEDIAIQVHFEPRL